MLRLRICNGTEALRLEELYRLGSEKVIGVALCDDLRAWLTVDHCFKMYAIFFERIPTSCAERLYCTLPPQIAAA